MRLKDVFVNMKYACNKRCNKIHRGILFFLFLYIWNQFLNFKVYFTKSFSNNKKSLRTQSVYIVSTLEFFFSYFKEKWVDKSTNYLDIKHVASSPPPPSIPLGEYS